MMTEVSLYLKVWAATACNVPLRLWVDWTLSSWGPAKGEGCNDSSTVQIHLSNNTLVPKFCVLPRHQRDTTRVVVLQSRTKGWIPVNVQVVFFN
jgi:hypothetical protein